MTLRAPRDQEERALCVAVARAAISRTNESIRSGTFSESWLGSEKEAESIVPQLAPTMRKRRIKWTAEDGTEYYAVCAGEMVQGGPGFQIFRADGKHDKSYVTYGFAAVQMPIYQLGKKDTVNTGKQLLDLIERPEEPAAPEQVRGWRALTRDEVTALGKIFGLFKIVDRDVVEVNTYLATLFCAPTPAFRPLTESEFGEMRHLGMTAGTISEKAARCSAFLAARRGGVASVWEPTEGQSRVIAVIVRAARSDEKKWEYLTSVIRNFQIEAAK